MSLGSVVRSILSEHGSLDRPARRVRARRDRLRGDGGHGASCTGLTGGSVEPAGDRSSTRCRRRVPGWASGQLPALAAGGPLGERVLRYDPERPLRDDSTAGSLDGLGGQVVSRAGTWRGSGHRPLAGVVDTGAARLLIDRHPRCRRWPKHTPGWRPGWPPCASAGTQENANQLLTDRARRPHTGSACGGRAPQGP